MRNRSTPITKAAAAFIAAAFSTPALAGTAFLDAAKDNTLYIDTNGLISNGSGVYMFVGMTSHEGPRRGLVAFNLPTAVPTNAIVSSAALDFVVSRGHLTSITTLHKLTKDWGEGASDAGDPGGGGAFAMTGDATWKYNFYNTSTWTTPGGDFVSSPSASAAVGFGTNQFSDPQMAADIQSWLTTPSSNFGWLLLGDESQEGSQTANRIDTRENTQSVGPRLTVNYAASTWNTSTSGAAWSNSANWLFGVPNAIGAEANFTFATPGPSHPQLQVNVDGPKTLGSLNIASLNSYQLTGSDITLHRAGNRSAVNSDSGTHHIAVRIHPDTITDITVAQFGTLILTQTLTATAPGAVINKFDDGTLSVESLRGADLNVNAGRVEIQPGGSDNGMSVINQLNLSSTTLDLNDNDLAVNNASFTTIKDLVLTGFGNPAAPGIVSSTSDGSQILALFDNALIGSPDWLGQPIGASAIVGKYTYFGDVNFDGQVTGDDYTIIDSNLNTTPPVGLEWLSGDANLDGIVTGDDYTTIDSNLGLGSGNPLAPSRIGSAIPEPTSLSLLILPALLQLRRQRPSPRL